MIERVCGDFLFELANRTDRLRLLGEIDGRLHGLDRGIVALRFGNHGQRLLGLLDRSRGNVALRKSCHRGDIGGIESQHLGIDLRRRGWIAFGEHGFGLLQDLGDIRLARRGHALGELLDEGVDLALREPRP